MLEQFDAPDSPPAVVGRSRAQTSPRTYWKCQIGRRLHLAREKARAGAAHERFGRSAFAKRLGISARQLWEIENGLVSIDAAEVALMAEALDVHPGSLFDDASVSPSATAQPSEKTSWLLAKAIIKLRSQDRKLLEELLIRLTADRNRA